MINARKYRNTKAVKENFDDLLAMGAVVHGSASPITVVPKKDNSLRICIDYTVLNAHTRPLSYPLPRIDELPEIIAGGLRLFTTLDLKEACYSLPIHPDSQKYAAIITSTDVFIPIKFQQTMDNIMMLCIY